MRTSVLLVDDQKVIHLGIKKMLAESPEIEFHSCYDSSEAVSIACELRPTIILQDINMPGADGMELLTAYRLEPSISKTPVLMLSASSDVEVKAKAFRLGADDYLVKTPHPIELIARVKYHSRAYNEHLERIEALAALEEERRKLKNANQELERLSSQDGLTSIANRRCFDINLKKEWLRAMRESESLSIIMIDVDSFKQYNDNYGHLAGDECLKLVASELSNQLGRSTDLLARYGGEEFVALLPSTSTHGAMQMAESMRKSIIDMQLPHVDSLGADVVSISLGVATLIPTTGSSSQQLLSVADTALYNAKDQGRNRVVCSPLS